MCKLLIKKLSYLPHLYIYKIKSFYRKPFIKKIKVTLFLLYKISYTYEIISLLLRLKQKVFNILTFSYEFSNQE